MPITQILLPFETSVVCDESTERNKSDNPNLQQHNCKKLNSQTPTNICHGPTVTVLTFAYKRKASRFDEVLRKKT